MLQLFEVVLSWPCVLQTKWVNGKTEIKMTWLKILSACCKGVLIQNYDMRLNKVGKGRSREILTPAADDEYVLDLTVLIEGCKTHLVSSVALAVVYLGGLRKESWSRWRLLWNLFLSTVWIYYNWFEILQCPLMLYDCYVCLKWQDVKVTDSCRGLCILRGFFYTIAIQRQTMIV